MLKVVLLWLGSIGLASVPIGCGATPRGHLHGRWFNEATSIRFRPDGSVVFNSTATGLTTGRFFFDGDLKPESAATPVNNLTLDLVVDGRLQRWPLEVQFLGNQRMRLQSVALARRGRPSDGIPGMLILRKAADESDAVASAR